MSDKKTSLPLEFTLNGERVATETAPEATLLSVLRDQLKVFGVKKGCGEGECGSCTVLVDGRPTLSCILPAMKAQGREITTIEGLSQGDQLHPIQEAFLEAGAVQCGFCTPGMVLSAKGLLDRNRNPSTEEIRESMSGNICRCTGYVQIEEAVRLAADKLGRSGDI